MIKKSFLLIFFALLYTANCKTVFFEEKFSVEKLHDNWTYSEHPGKEYGTFTVTSGKFYNDPENDKGIKTMQDARFYAVSYKFKEFSNLNIPLVIQFSVKHEQSIDCGGGYLKIFNSGLNQKDMHGETPYEIMFGPDICGPGTKKVHVIFSYKGKNHLIKKDIKCKDDVFTHFYTLIVNPDNTYKVLIDNEKVESGNLEDDWDFLPPKEILDPEAKKPEDWDERKQIPDPDDKKPEDYDKPEHIPDPEATKPENWDDEMDGEWEPPLIDNPEYKGPWQPRSIDNPAYKGIWEHPKIDNPEYKGDSELYLRKSLNAIGFDLWQVKSGTIFDNILITDSEEYAKEAASGVKATQDGEMKMKAKQDKEEKEKEANEENKVDSKGDDESEDDEEDGTAGEAEEKPDRDEL